MAIRNSLASPGRTARRWTLNYIVYSKLHSGGSGIDPRRLEKHTIEHFYMEQ